MKIGELARRSGVSTPTLRFYEEIGLLEPAHRTPSGYREYRPEAESRLAFIARAKTLGLSLEEIKELLQICAGEGCGASAVRLRHVLAHKIEEVRTQIEEQQRFKEMLEGAYSRVADAESLRRELRIIGSVDCTCEDESCARECECCPAEEVSSA